MNYGIPNIDHCVLDASGTPPVMRCNHCQGTEVVHFPVNVTRLKNTGDSFMKAHRKCRPNAANTCYPDEQS